jgi:hypothetical protein
MRDYGKIYSAIWSSPDFLSFSDDSKLLVFYLLTSTHTTMTGAFRLPDGYLSADLGWTNERVNKGLSELFAKGFCNRCETTKWLWICKYLRWNPPENPNQWKAITKQADQVPEKSAWKQDFMRSLAKLYGENYPDNRNPFGTVHPTVSKPVVVIGTVIGTGVGTEELQLGAEDGSQPEIVVSIPLNDKTDYPITTSQVEGWNADFPGIDVIQELRKCRQWNIANPKNRKTRSGVLRHITAWLSRAQDKAPVSREPPGDPRESARRMLFGEEPEPIEGEARIIQ